MDRNYPQPVALAIDVNLKDPIIRKSIVEPVKALMEPGQINSLVLNDQHSHATITYSLSGGGTSEDETTAGDNTDNSQSDSQ